MTCKFKAKRTKKTFTSPHAYIRTVWESRTCPWLFSFSNDDVSSLSRSKLCVRHLRRVSVIVHFNKTVRPSRDKRHFHQPLWGGDEGKENRTLSGFQTYQFHVSGHWNAKILVCLFPTRYLSFLPSFFNLFVIPY